MPRHQCSGGGAGITGERSGMWKHMARIIGEVRPRYAFVENSPMLTTRGLGVVLADLSSLGFNAKWGVVSAADVGANHLRERIWIRAKTNVVDTKSGGGRRVTGEFQAQDEQQTTKRQERRVWQSDYASEMVVPNVHGCVATEITASTQETIRQQQAGTGNALNIEGTSGVPTAKSNVANTGEIGLSGEKAKQRMGGKFRFAECGMDRNWWAREPESTPRTIERNLGGMVDGVAARVDRLKAIGNGQVPLCAATAWELLK
jgi:DNA (cytosine-5)-methyltransferase 1